MPKVYGYIYKITNIENNRVYIGQTKRGFKKRYGIPRYGRNSIHNVYKHSHNEDLKLDIEKYNDDKYWIIEPEFDIAYSEEELNEKEFSLFMQYVWDNMPTRKRKDLRRFSDEDYDENTWYYSWRKEIPPILYNKATPTPKKTRDRRVRYIYTTNKIPIMFTSQVKIKKYVEAQEDNFKIGRFPYVAFFERGYGRFCIPWMIKWRLSDNSKVPRVKNISRCYKYRSSRYIEPLYKEFVDSNGDIHTKVLVEYTGIKRTYRVRNIYKPFRLIKIRRFEVIK